MSENKNKISILFYCTRCHMILFEVFQRMMQYDSLVFSKGYGYDFNSSGDMEHDCYKCPICNGQDMDDGLVDDGNGNMVPTKTLETFEIPMDSADSLAYAWMRYKEREAENSEFGIPFDRNRDLKEQLIDLLI